MYSAPLIAWLMLLGVCMRVSGYHYNHQEQSPEAPNHQPLVQPLPAANHRYHRGSRQEQEITPDRTEEECDPDMIGFELVTGYVFSAPGQLLESLPGTLMLTDCLDACQGNDSCRAVNYETGLCVLFASNADNHPGALSKSQFPVFTIYAQKSCLSVRPCSRAWCFDRVRGHGLLDRTRRTQQAASRQECLELCLGETDFLCRSANYHEPSGSCDLSDMDRITLGGTNAFQEMADVDYLENNCIEEPTKLCEFKRLSGRILKTVDSVYQDVASAEECRDLCLNSPYRCHSYDYGDTGEMVCRLSHHSRATLSDIQDPYLNVPEAATYELSSCYNVTIECRSTDMIARIHTSKLFDGKVYAKGSPNSCSVDVKQSLEFELTMKYQDLECNVRHNGMGRYLNDVVIQHHDTIVTSSDLGLAVTCQYDLTNKTVANDVDLGVTGETEPALSEEVIVDSPNVIMKVTARDGSDIMQSAEVGDSLALRFEILDESSPYEIFVRELIAMDGADSGEITLIDSDGCPTDQFIMGPIYRSLSSDKVLLSHFDAFKFPSSEVVQFRALVTPCMPTCAPAQCDTEDISSGDSRSLLSYGRRKRSINATDSLRSQQQKQHDDMLLMQTIHITDKFNFERRQQQQQNQNSQSTSTVRDNITSTSSNSADSDLCVNGLGLIFAGAIFLALQMAIVSIWTVVWQCKRKQKVIDTTPCVIIPPQSRIFNQHRSNGTSSSATSSAGGSSMRKLYTGNNFNRQHY